MANEKADKNSWRDHLAPFASSESALFDSAFLNRWGQEIWNPAEVDKKAAAELRIELISRVATQRLEYSEGSEAAALQSMFSLFGKAREAGQKNLGANHFEVLAWHVLNSFVRPFTSKWHPQNEKGALSALDTTDEFRIELVELQTILRLFDDLLVYLRDGRRAPQIPTPGANAATIKKEMEERVRWGISKARGGVPDEVAENLNVAEKIAITARRKKYGLPVDNPNAAGLALSGGGIRSATFSLGVLVALARRNLLPQFDYLSTVSGGGYLGAFLTTYMATPLSRSADSDIGLAAGQLPFRRSDGEADALRYIRHRSKYLNTSLWERVNFAIAQTYGMLINCLALALLPASVAIFDYLFRPSVESILSPISFVASLVLLLVGLAIVLPVLMRLFPSVLRQADRALAAIVVVILLLLAWEAIGWLHQGVDRYFAEDRVNSGLILIVVLGLTPVLASAAIAFMGRHFGRSQRIVAAIAGPVIPVFLVAIELGVYRLLGGNAVDLSGFGVPRWCIAVLVVVVLLLIMTFALDVNLTSLHRHYRNKLAETFLIQPAANSEQPARLESSIALPLSACMEQSRAPYHLFNCALNVPGTANPAMQGRLTDFFLFSQAYCGSPLVGYWPSGDWERADPSLNVSSAMAISAAAASPLMGLGTSKHLRFWMALFNVRLGYWVRKPSRSIRRSPGLFYLLREMFGNVDESQAYLNVTDGGHVENLGVYELLRRRCKFIVAVDGEHDPSMTFHALTNLQRLASIDLGTTIDVNLDDLRLNAQGLSRSHFQFCRIRYPVEPGEKQAIGYLLYLKLSLTGNEGEFIRRYRLDEPEFPHHSTADQFFTEAQFEAYRVLGEHIGDKAFIRAIVGDLSDSEDVAVEAWFSAIGHSLLHPKSQ